MPQGNNRVSQKIPGDDPVLEPQIEHQKPGDCTRSTSNYSEYVSAKMYRKKGIQWDTL